MACLGMGIRRAGLRPVAELELGVPRVRLQAGSYRRDLASSMASMMAPLASGNW